MRSGYLIRYYTLLPFRRLILLLVKIVSKVPGTTFGEIAEMSMGPCPRCVGRSVQDFPMG